MIFNIEYTNENLQSNTGLAVFSKMLEEVNPEPIFQRYQFTNRSTSYFYSDKDVLLSYLGLLLSGQINYEHIDFCRTDLLYKRSLCLEKVPSKETIRQRCDILSRCNPLIFEVLNEWNQKLLERYALPGCIKGTELIPVDFDVTVLDNTGSKKEGVSQTYQKKIEGYAPMMSNIGSQGYLLNLDFREGRRHSNCPGTSEYILRTMNLARRLCPKQKLLARFDSGNDADANIVDLSDYPNSYFVIKHQQRGCNAARTKALLIEEVMNNYSTKHIKQGNAIYYNWEKESIACIIDKKGNQVMKSCRKILSVVELTHDINTGALLLIPYRSLHMWRTNLPKDQYSAEQVIELYKDHGTSEQFHSEFKSDLDVERLPSRKFLTNKLIMSLAKIAFNILRIIGHQAIQSRIIKPQKNLTRIRLRTVLLKIIYLPSKLIRKHKRWTIVLPRSNPLSQLFWEIYKQI